jgi:hypothetical protein
MHLGCFILWCIRMNVVSAVWLLRILSADTQPYVRQPYDRRLHVQQPRIGSDVHRQFDVRMPHCWLCRPRRDAGRIQAETERRPQQSLALHEAARQWLIRETAMCANSRTRGDGGCGISDAPALAAADVGIALGCRSDLARDSAEICLAGDDLRRLAWVIALSRRTVRTIRQNLVWAFGYNAVGVLIAPVRSGGAFSSPSSALSSGEGDSSMPNANEGGEGLATRRLQILVMVCTLALSYLR